AARSSSVSRRAARNPPQLNAVVVTGAPAAPPSQQAPPSSADVPGRDVDGRSPQIPGYTMTQSESVPSVTVRRYVPSAGPPVTLLIVQAPRKPGARGAAGDGQPELTLSTVEGQSIVRWHAQDRDYELRGALAPDSLVKLATLLR
ncbi:MAG TPA: hypothetical protein VE861_16220, partial [Gemmatimonadaceae bacterium]|nr:hypothetical protein [Gemmatimonadaceae bacterium]